MLHAGSWGFESLVAYFMKELWEVDDNKMVAKKPKDAEALERVYKAAWQRAVDLRVEFLKGVEALPEDSPSRIVLAAKACDMVNIISALEILYLCDADRARKER